MATAEEAIAICGAPAASDRDANGRRMGEMMRNGQEGTSSLEFKVGCDPLESAPDAAGGRGKRSHNLKPRRRGIKGMRYRLGRVLQSIEIGKVLNNQLLNRDCVGRQGAASPGPH
ncbi:uncharacterized protein VTP21DRAFT_5388 [Calcarisporiella thermophila]|uniref:uncharacterized protein n=1 Tax=Calcarisporiella thermophila TaxID=911321 RepID=UPI0037436F2B